MRRNGWFPILALAAGAAYYFRQPLQRLFRQVSQLDPNTASREQLMALPGVSADVADRIIENRPYHSLLDMVSRRAVFGDAFDQIKSRLRVASEQRAA